MLHTKELAIGDCVRLVDFGDTPLTYRRKLLSLGITRGVTVQIIRFAPLGCPMQIEVRNTAISLRKEEANCIIWERV